MKRSTIMIAGAGALVVGGVGYVMWRRRQEAKHQVIVDTVKSRGKDKTMLSTDGKKLVAIAGGVGAGAGRPIDTSTRVRVVADGKVFYVDRRVR
jgi:uncharacterized iron-regulated membrane protein